MRPWWPWTTSCGGGTTSRARVRPPSNRSTAAATACLARSAGAWLTEVRLMRPSRAIGLSSYPTIAKSYGTNTPARTTASRMPTALRSLAATASVARSPPARNAWAARFRRPRCSPPAPPAPQIRAAASRPVTRAAAARGPDRSPPSTCTIERWPSPTRRSARGRAVSPPCSGTRAACPARAARCGFGSGCRARSRSPPCPPRPAGPPPASTTGLDPW